MLAYVCMRSHALTLCQPILLVNESINVCVVEGERERAFALNRSSSGHNIAALPAHQAAQKCGSELWKDTMRAGMCSRGERGEADTHFLDHCDNSASDQRTQALQLNNLTGCRSTGRDVDG